MDQARLIHPAFGDFLRLLDIAQLKREASLIYETLKPNEHYRALTLVGGQSVQNEQIAFNDFGRVLAANFQTLFDPASYEDRLKIVENAYVGSPRKERYIGEIDRIIRNAAPALISGSTNVNDTSNPVEITSRFQDLPALRNKILLLVGAVGSGKSTFVDYLRHKSFSAELNDALAWVRIDLNVAPVTADEIYPWLRRRIIEGIKSTSPDIDTSSIENLRKLYREHVRDFDAGVGSLFEKTSGDYRSRLADLLEGLKADQVETIKCLEQFLCTGRGRLLILTLDNCDKRDRDEQLLMFQVAKYIQQEVRCLIILPLRYETFENHRDEPPLDTALKDLVYRIEPPSFHEVLNRRLGLVLSEAKHTSKSLSYYAGTKTIEFPVERLERFLHAMMGSLFDHQQYGRKIIIGLAGWNIRKAFEIFLEFCRSGFIKEEDIFERQVTTGKLASLPVGTVAKVLLRTSRRYYCGDHSFVKNLFQSNPGSPTPSSFIRYFILTWLRSRTGLVGPSGVKGYHRQGDLVHDLLVLANDPASIRGEVRYLAKSGCILPEHLRPDAINDGDLLSITPAGQVHLELAHRDINYLAACAEDSWVNSFNLADSVRARITQQPFYRGLSWTNILSNAEEFCEYLRERHGNALLSAPFLPPHRGDDFALDFTKISEEIAAHRSKLKGYQGSGERRG